MNSTWSLLCSIALAVFSRTLEAAQWLQGRTSLNLASSFGDLALFRLCTSIILLLPCPTACHSVWRASEGCAPTKDRQIQRLSPFFACGPAFFVVLSGLCCQDASQHIYGLLSTGVVRMPSKHEVRCSNHLEGKFATSVFFCSGRVSSRFPFCFGFRFLSSGQPQLSALH
jgi:hypothetical protein